MKAVETYLGKYPVFGALWVGSGIVCIAWALMWIVSSIF